MQARDSSRPLAVSQHAGVTVRHILIVPSRNIGPLPALMRFQFSCPRWLFLDFL
jgi:hypothetical protein